MNFAIALGTIKIDSPLMFTGWDYFSGNYI